ncbi:sugar ABC transporter substrate-binding protein [Herbidospora sp. RD11066]
MDVAQNAYFPSPVSRRAFLAAAGAAGIAVSVAACGGADPKPAAAGPGSPGVKRDKSWCLVTTLTNDYFVAFADGAKQAMQGLGVSMDVLEDQANVNTALSQIGNVRAVSGKSIFGIAASEAEAAAVTKACESGGILWANAYTAPAWYTPADSDAWVQFITPQSTKIAEATARALFEKVGGSGTIIHVPGQKGASSDVQRTAGLQKALADYPGIEIVTTSPGNWVAEDARNAFNNVLPKVKDFVGVFAQNDSEAAGVIAALDAQKITGKVVTGFDGNQQNVEYIADGKQLLTSATVGGLTAGLLGIAVFDALNGIEFTLPERFLAQGAVMVDPENASQVLSSVYKKELPFDWAKMSRALNPDSWDPQTLLTPIDPKPYFEGFPQEDYRLNPAWEKVDFADATAKYKDAFKSGPLMAFKDALV